MTVEALKRDLPPVTLLLGPDVARLRNLARHAAAEHRVVTADRLMLQGLSAADARNIIRFARTASFGPFKLVIIALDGASAAAQNILLKVLEEPPPTIRFILVASARPLPTIMSRCQVITVPGQDIQGEAGGKAAAQVAAALAAAVAGNLHGLDVALKDWGAAQHAALTAQLAAAASQARDADVTAGLTRRQARRLLGTLSRFDGAQPRLAAHAALAAMSGDMRGEP